MRNRKSSPLLAAGLLALFSFAPPLAAGEGGAGAYVAAISRQPWYSQNMAIHVVDVGTMRPVIHGPFFQGTFTQGISLTMLRDRPAGIVDHGADLSLIDFSNPAAPVIAATATLPFDPREVTRLANFRDELLALGPAGELAVIDPRTLGILASFTLPSPRLRARTSGDGRLLLTQVESPRMAFLASFDPLLGPGAEVPMRDDWSVNFNDVVFSPDQGTAVLVSTFCFQVLLGPPFCNSLLNVYDTSSPAKPDFREEIDPVYDKVTSVVLDRAGGRFIFHQRGNEEWYSPNHLLPFTIAGPGTLVPEPIVELSVTGDFEMSGLVRTAGAKRLLVFTSESFPASHPIALPRLHDLDPVTLAGSSFPLPLPLEPRGVFHIGAAIFADGFESGTIGAWGPTDL